MMMSNPPQDVINQPWYHGRVDRATAENLLSGKRPGLYLVRDSSSCLGDYVLSVSENNKVSHYIISRRGPLYLIGDQSFHDLPSVIEFYKTHFLDTTTLTEVVQHGPSRSLPAPVRGNLHQGMTGPPSAGPPPTINPQPLPPPIPVIGTLRVRGKFDFRSEDPEDLHFKKGDMMTVLRKDEDEWWYARHDDGRQGSIPVPYLEVIEEQPLFARALNDRECPYDPTALSFKKGETIRVLRQNENGVWEGESSTGRHGHFPFKLVEVIDSNNRR